MNGPVAWQVDTYIIDVMGTNVPNRAAKIITDNKARLTVALSHISYPNRKVAKKMIDEQITPLISATPSSLSNRFKVY